MAEEDLIFGKNRHFFGGIEPSNMTTFSAVVDNGIVKIIAQLPSDTVINGHTLCTVAGAVIRRKATGYPTDEFDGDLVIDISESGTYVDSTADPTATYIYAAFPYTTQGVYNINSDNTAGINLPGDMAVFMAKSSYDGSVLKVVITAELPEGVAGAVIRKSASGYPVNETDGEAVANITSNGTYDDTNVVDKTKYYYSAFPYSSAGIHNRSENNRAEVTTVTYGYLFGYDLDTADSDPSTRVTYPSDVNNASYDPAYMDFSAGTFNYGSWPSTAGDKFMPKPCMLGYNGKVICYLNPNNYVYKEGSTSKTSGVTSSSTKGNAMMEWPKIYTKRWKENSIYHFRCSDTKIDDDYECWCNYDKNNNEIDHFYTAIYDGAISSVYPNGGSTSKSGIRSLSGYSPSTAYSLSDFLTYATNNGDDWHTDVISDRLLIQDLLVMMGKSTNSRSVYGNGVSGTSHDYMKTGELDAKGLFWGSNTSANGLKVFGMEHFWGNYERFITGLIMVSGSLKIKITRGTKDGTTASDYNTNGSGYLSVNSVSGSSGSYIMSMDVYPFGRLVRTVRGSATTYECDGAVWNPSATRYLTMAGSHTSDTSGNGPFRIYLSNTLASESSYKVASLSCKPSAT